MGSRIVEVVPSGVSTEYDESTEILGSYNTSDEFEETSMLSDHDNKIILPYTIKRNDYIFTVRKTTITKTYSSYEKIKYFDMPFNSYNLNISHVSLVGRYLTI